MGDNKQEIAGLVEKVQQGDMNAFGKLYEIVSPRSLFVAMEIVKNKQDAEDILQDSFITALEKINTLEKGESFVGWFNRIVANKSKDFLKKKKPMLFGEEEKQVFELIPDEDREFSPQENFNDNETRKMVLDAVNELSDEKRICVLLHYYNEMSVADIAQTVGTNENTVKSRLFQARKDLSAKFKELERKGLYSFSPIGLVLWAWQYSEDSITKGFIGSESSSAILASVTAKAGAGAASAAATSTAAGTAVTTAAAISSGAATTAATGTGLAAKIAALTIAQKVTAGIVITGVVAGSAVGTATVIKKVSEEPEETTTTAIYAVGDKVVTSSEWFESNVVITDLSETETAEEAISVIATATEKVTEKITEEPSCTVAPTTRKSEATKAETQAPSQTEKKTKKSTTRRDYSLNQTKASTTATTKPVTTKPTTTTKKQTTTEEPETTAKKATTTKKVTTTKPTTRPVTTTVKPTTTTRPTTTEATTLSDPIVRIHYMPPDSSEYIDYPEFSVPPGTNLNIAYLYNFMMNESGIEMVDCMIDSGDFIESAESGKTYNFVIICG